MRQDRRHARADIVSPDNRRMTHSHTLDISDAVERPRRQHARPDTGLTHPRPVGLLCRRLTPQKSRNEEERHQARNGSFHRCLQATVEPHIIARENNSNSGTEEQFYSHVATIAVMVVTPPSPKLDVLHQGRLRGYSGLTRGVENGTMMVVWADERQTSGSEGPLDRGFRQHGPIWGAPSDAKHRCCQAPCIRPHGTRDLTLPSAATGCDYFVIRRLRPPSPRR